jgi:hypothetical protein
MNNDQSKLITITIAIRRVVVEVNNMIEKY